MNLQRSFDHTGMGLSIACTLHCLALPVAMTLLPSLASLPLADEAFHATLLAVVIPVSLLALMMGCRKHRQGKAVYLGLVGLALLIFSFWAGHEALGDWLEKMLVTTGSVIMACSHIINQKLCRTHSCACDSSSTH